VAKDSEEFSGFLATPWLDATYYSMWIQEKVNQPLSMAHNVLEISGLTGLAFFTTTEG